MSASYISECIYAKDMNASESEVEETNEDVWDDKKLNDAYDKALRIANAEVAKRVAMSTNSRNKGGSAPANAKDKKPKEIKVSDKKLQWKVGMPCRAVYEEDGLEYEAVVLRIINNKECIVRFLGYNNSEIVPIASLKQTQGKEIQAEQIEQALSDKVEGYNEDSNEDRMEIGNEGRTSSPVGTERSYQKRKKSNKKKRHQNQIPADFHLPDMPMGSIPMPNVNFRNLNIDMPVPPIPPPFLPSTGLGDSEEQAVSSMLLSWYMSGYYTGLYQGLRRAKESRKH